MSAATPELVRWRQTLGAARRVALLTGAGVSAESGVPTFRGAGGLWRRFSAPQLATPSAFRAQPSLVWEFYHYRRELARAVDPNPAHIAIAEFEERATREGKTVTLITQNIDNLHTRAGSKNIVELHGNLYKTRCTKCKNVTDNHDSPICEALAGKGAPDPSIESEEIPLDELPRCKKDNCNGLLRPHIVWFGENLELSIIDRADDAIRNCDVCLVIGTSASVYPAAMFAPQVASRGVPVAEFNIEPTPSTHEFEFYFEGKCGTTIPEALNY